MRWRMIEGIIVTSIKIRTLLFYRYMDLSDETIKNKKYENKDDAQAFNREIIKTWMYKNSGDCVKVRHSTDCWATKLIRF